MGLDDVLGLAALVFFAVIVVPTAVPLLQALPMLAADARPCGPDLTQHVFDLAARAVDPARIVDLGFTPCGAYRVDLRFAKAYFAVWRHGEDPTFLAVYCVGLPTRMSTWTIDFFSELSLDPAIALTTSSTRSGTVQVLRPGTYIQSFSTSDPETLWRHHADGEAFVADRHGIEVLPLEVDVGESLASWARDGARYLLRHPWLALKTPWAFFVGQFLYHNRTLRDRYGKSG